MTGNGALVRPLAVFAEESLQQMAGKQGFRAQLKHECSSSNDEIMALARSRQIWRIRPCVWRISKPKAVDGKGGVGSTDRANA